MNNSQEFLTTVLYPYVNLTLFIIGLIYFGRRPISEMLAKRRADFQESAQVAEKSYRTLEKKLIDVDAKYRHLNEEMDRLQKEAEEDIEREKARVQLQSEQIVEQIRLEAQQIIRAEFMDVRQKLLDGALKELGEQFQLVVLQSADKERFQKAYWHAAREDLNKIRSVGGE